MRDAVSGLEQKQHKLPLLLTVSHLNNYHNYRYLVKHNLNLEIVRLSQRMLKEDDKYAGVTKKS